jgi:hypothetical protein
MSLPGIIRNEATQNRKPDKPASGFELLRGGAALLHRLNWLTSRSALPQSLDLFQRARAGIHGVFAEQLLDAQELVVFRQTIRTAQGTGLDLAQFVATAMSAMVASSVSPEKSPPHPSEKWRLLAAPCGINCWKLGGIEHQRAMTLQTLARISRQVMGWVYLTFGFLDIAVSSYIFSVDHRREIALILALQIPVSLFLIWIGGKRIYDSNRAG